jgi:hypothetical protein
MAYIHGTEARERARRPELNRMTNAAFVGFLGVAGGERVLEAGSEVTGVEKPAERLDRPGL